LETLDEVSGECKQDAFVPQCICSYGQEDGRQVVCLPNYWLHQCSYELRSIATRSPAAIFGSKFLQFNCVLPHCMISRKCRRGIFASRNLVKPKMWGRHWNHISICLSCHKFNDNPDNQQTKVHVVKLFIPVDPVFSHQKKIMNHHTSFPKYGRSCSREITTVNIHKQISFSTPVFEPQTFGSLA